jgi:hypothetical protein
VNKSTTLIAAGANEQAVGYKKSFWFRFDWPEKSFFFIALITTMKSISTSFWFYYYYFFSPRPGFIRVV